MCRLLLGRAQVLLDKLLHGGLQLLLHATRQLADVADVRLQVLVDLVHGRLQVLVQVFVQLGHVRLQVLKQYILGIRFK